MYTITVKCPTIEDIESFLSFMDDKKLEYGGHLHSLQRTAKYPQFTVYHNEGIIVLASSRRNV